MVLFYEDAKVPYSVAEAQFDLSNDRLDIYIQLEIGNEEAKWPPEILIRFSNLEFDEQNQALHIFDEHTDWDERADDDRPHGYIYSGFHYRKVSAWVLDKNQSQVIVVDTLREEAFAILENQIPVGWMISPQE
jgi:hypothetical protein